MAMLLDILTCTANGTQQVLVKPLLVVAPAAPRPERPLNADRGARKAPR